MMLRPLALSLAVVLIIGVSTDRARPEPGEHEEQNKALSAMAPWSPQLHQNHGGACSGHHLCWGDQNFSITADHLAISSQDASQINYVMMKGSVSAGDRIGLQWEIAGKHYETYVTVPKHSPTPETAMKLLAAELNGGVAAVEEIASAGSGYHKEDHLTPQGGECSRDPTLRVMEVEPGSGAIRRAEVVAAGNGIFGGSCTAAAEGPVSVTGGHGSGAVFKLKWGNTRFAAALRDFHDASGFGYVVNSGWTPIGELPRIGFDQPFGTSVATCPGTGRDCPHSSATLVLQFDGSMRSTDANRPPLDNGPYFAGARLVPGRAPRARDELTCFYFGGQSSAHSDLDTQYGQVCGGITDLTDPENPIGAVTIGTSNAISHKIAIPVMYFSRGAYMGGANGRALPDGGPGSFDAASIFVNGIRTIDENRHASLHDITLTNGFTMQPNNGVGGAVSLYNANNGEGLHLYSNRAKADLVMFTDTGHGVHQEYGGETPRLEGACGQDAVAGNDVVGRIRIEGSVVGSCTLIFAAAWKNPPVCSIANERPGGSPVSPRATQTALILTPTARLAPGDSLTYHCIGYR